MARLVAVCRDGEEEFPFEKRQIPLYIDDTLTVSPRGPVPLSRRLPRVAIPRPGFSSCRASLAPSRAPAALIFGTLQHLGLAELNVATFFYLMPGSKSRRTA